MAPMVGESKPVDLRGRVALVTGAAHGIGAATAQLMAASGATVWLVDVDAETVGEHARALADAGGLVEALPADVTDPDALEGLRDAIARHDDGCLDILVANVGVMFHEDIDTVSVEAWDRCFRVNLTSVMLTIQTMLPLLEASEAASIVTMSSGAAFSPRTLAGVAYASAKAGVAQLTRVLATRLGPRGIRVNAVAPGAADTDMSHQFGDEALRALTDRIPLGRLASADEVATAVLYLASPLGSYVNGHVLHVSGGL